MKSDESSKSNKIEDKPNNCVDNESVAKELLIETSEIENC
jgi:hypothetical protein